MLRAPLMADHSAERTMTQKSLADLAKMRDIDIAIAFYKDRSRRVIASRP